MITELTEYCSKGGFFGKAVVLTSASVTELTLWWEGVCYNSKLAKFAVSMQSVPPTFVEHFIYGPPK